MEFKQRRKVWLVARRSQNATEWCKQLALESGLHLAEGVYSDRLFACKAAGLGAPLGTVAPLRAPHHSIGSAQLTGKLTGHRWTPGELALAHGGVLVLDDATEFGLGALGMVESAWRHGGIRLWSNTAPQFADSVESNKLAIPTWFSLVVITLPCPCGNRGAPRAPCPCTDRQIEQFHAKVRQLTDGAEVVRLADDPKDYQSAAEVG